MEKLQVNDANANTPYVKEYPKGMNAADCETHLTNLLNEFGIQSLTHKWLIDNGYKRLYARYNTAMQSSLRSFAEKKGVAAELKQYIDRHSKWTPELLKSEIARAVREYGFLPPTPFLNGENGYQGLGSAITSYGGMKTIKELYQIPDRLRLFDKQGSIWASFPESALSNYLLSKGVKAKKGERYPAAYAEMSGMAYGVYDMHFVATAGPLTGRQLNIEIFGDNPGGRSAEEYAKVRMYKEAFNKDDECFVVIEHRDCYKQTKLDAILSQHIAPVQSLIDDNTCVSALFDAPLLSLADEVLARLKKVCEYTPGGLLPSTGWFRRTDCHSDRTIEEWEPATWLGLIDNVNDCGGITKFRKALGQDDSHLRLYQLNKADTIQGLKEFYNKHNKTPVTYQAKDKRALSADEKVDWARALELTSCMNRHFATPREACKAAGIPMVRRNVYGSAEAVMEDLIQYYKDHGGKSPKSIEKKLRKIQSDNRTLEQKELLRDSYALQSNSRKYFESFQWAWKAAVAAATAT